jgi:hypothetical protein
MADPGHADTSAESRPLDLPPTGAGPGARRVDRRAMVMNLLLTVIFDVGLAIVAFNVAKNLGANDQIAYLVSGIGPLTMMVVTWVRARTLSGASAVILLFLLLSAATAFIGGTDFRQLIAKDSLVTGGFGVACLVSLLFPRPLMFYFGAKFATDGTKEGLQYWSGLWQYPEFRRSQYLINNVWGIGFLIEAAIRVFVAYTVSSVQLANAIATIIPWVFLAGLLTFTVTIGKRSRAAGEARSRAATAPSPAVGSVS